MNKQNALHFISYGMYIVSSWDNGRPIGCVANSIMQITSNPPTVAVSINHNNFTNSCIMDTGLFAVSVLSQDSDVALIGTFGYTSSKGNDKFAKFSMHIQNYLPIPDGSIASFTCKICDTLETATHTVFLGEVTSQNVTDDKAPVMTYDYYRSVIKGKSPENAPTFNI